MSVKESRLYVSKNLTERLIVVKKAVAAHEIGKMYFDGHVLNEYVLDCLDIALDLENSIKTGKPCYLDGYFDAVQHIGK